MAEQQDDIEVVNNNKRKNKLLLIIVIVLLISVLGLTAVIFMKDNHATDHQAEMAKQAPIYYTVESPFIVNFSEQSDGAVRYLQIKMKVMARNQNAIDAFSLHLPAIQHDLLGLFYSQNYDDLQTNGTQALQQTTLDGINTLLLDETGLENGLEAVYFTSFLMQ